MEYQPYMDNLYRHKMIVRIMQEKSYMNIFTTDLTKEFMADLRDIANPEHHWTQNTIISMSGDTGCQPRGSKVLTSDLEWKDIADIEVGDIIMSFDAKRELIPSNVLHVTSFICHENYEVLSEKGKQLYECSFNHLIPVNIKNIYHTISARLLARRDSVNSIIYQDVEFKPRKVSVRRVQKPKRVFGFTLDSDTGLYLTNDFMLTHNSGKSICMMSIGLNVFKNFSYKNMFFFDQQILDNADKFPQNTFIVRDENTQKGIYGMGSNRTTSQFGVMAETCRKAGLNLGMVEPIFTQTGITKLYLETVDYDIRRRITRCALRDAKTLKYLGAVYIPVIPDDNHDWIQYNIIKDKFIESIKSGQMDGAKADYDNIVNKVIAEIDPDIYTTKKERKAFIMKKYPVLTSGEIDVISTLLEVEIRQLAR